MNVVCRMTADCQEDVVTSVRRHQKFGLLAEGRKNGERGGYEGIIGRALQLLNNLEQCTRVWNTFRCSSQFYIRSNMRLAGLQLSLQQPGTYFSEAGAIEIASCQRCLTKSTFLNCAQNAKRRKVLTVYMYSYILQYI